MSHIVDLPVTFPLREAVAGMTVGIIQHGNGSLRWNDMYLLRNRPWKSSRKQIVPRNPLLLPFLEKGAEHHLCGVFLA